MNLKKYNPNPTIKEKKKWQQSSEAFRQAIRSAKKDKQLQQIEQPNDYEYVLRLQQNINKEEQNVQQQLLECRKGCGRRFNPSSRIKHEAICVKIFQSKRHQYNSQMKRVNLHTLVYLRKNQVKINKLKDDTDKINIPLTNGCLSLFKSQVLK